MCVGVYTSLSLCIIMYTHKKAKHMMFQLCLYIGPCLLEEVPRRILLPLFFTRMGTDTVSQDGEAWRPHSQNQTHHAGCHSELISEKFHNSFQPSVVAFTLRISGLEKGQCYRTGMF